MNTYEKNNWHLKKEYSDLERYMERLLTFDMISSHWSGGDVDIPIEHKQALILLKDFFGFYEKCELSKKFKLYEGYEFHYYDFLVRATIFHVRLMKNNLVRAVHELYDTLNYYPGLQTRVHSALMTSWKMYKEKYPSEFDIVF